METFYAIKQIHPDIEQYFVSGAVKLDEAGAIAVWECPHQQPTIEELETAWADYLAGRIPTLRTAAIGAMNLAFYAAACTLTAEPNLDAIKLKQWDDKFAIALTWHAAGRPAVTSENYPDAVIEAGNRADQYSDPDALIASWYVNGLTWNGINQAYRTEFEPAKRAWIRAEARTVEELQAVSVAGLTGEILAALVGAV
jgi:hypothetical protein